MLRLGREGYGARELTDEPAPGEAVAEAHAKFDQFEAVFATMPCFRTDG